MIISVIFCFFRRLPRFVFYDAACNLVSSLLTRFLWAFKGTRFLVERFHYGKGHTCGLAMDPNACPAADGMPTSNVESINSLIGSVRGTISHLRPSLYVSFVGERCVYLNLLSRWRRQTKKTDIEGADVTVLANRLMPCGCDRCLLFRDTKELFREEEKRRYTAGVASTSREVLTNKLIGIGSSGDSQAISYIGTSRRDLYDPHVRRFVQAGVRDLI
jgi:hypothetical protein